MEQAFYSDQFVYMEQAFYSEQFVYMEQAFYSKQVVYMEQAFYSEQIYLHEAGFLLKNKLFTRGKFYTEYAWIISSLTLHPLPVVVSINT
ncbi:hypothetical protein ABIB30_000467 [Pedobacter sp. UYP1]